MQMTAHKITPRSELERKYRRFEEKVLYSSSFWKTIAQVIKGNNNATAVAKTLGKNKSILSRQLRELARVELLDSSGDGEKQSYRINWDIFTTYWTSDADDAALTASMFYQESS